MISVSGKKWEQKIINQNFVDKLKQEYDFSEILSRLIISRKFDNDEIATINTDLDLNNVFLNNEDFNQSIKLVVNCINNNEKIKSKFCKFKHFNALSSGQADIFLLYSLEKVNKKCHNKFFIDPKNLSLLVTSEKVFKYMKKNNSDLLKFIFNNVFSIGKKHFNKVIFQKKNNILKLITREKKKNFSNCSTLSINNQKDLNTGKEFIVNYLGTHKDDTIVMEYLSKGGNYIELFNAITIVNYFKSDVHGLLRVFENILLAVKFLHHIGICHGDIKAENIFISTSL